MRQLQPVLWTKGLALSPQHLQAQDRHFEDFLGSQLSALSPWLWGFDRLVLDGESLARGEVLLVEASGIFPDGAVFALPESDGPVPPRVASTAFAPDAAALTVYLALPESRSDGRNVAMLGEDLSTRFVAEVVRRRDDNTGLAERELQVARKNLRLLFDSESLEGHTSLPIARLTRSDAGVLEEDPEFVAPLISASASRVVQSIAQRLVERLAARSAQLSALRRQRSGNLAHFSVSDVGNFWLLYTVNAYLPVLRHLATRQGGHPSELFHAMLGLAGSLTTFSIDVEPASLPVYTHRDPGPGFLQLEALLLQLLERAIPQNCVAIPLRQLDATTSAASLDEDRLLRPVAAYLAVRSPLSPADIASEVPKKVKLSSSDRISALVRQALPGARLTHTPSPPSAVPIRLDAQYFEVTRSGADWDGIVSARNIAAYVPSDLVGASMEVIFLLPERT